MNRRFQISVWFAVVCAVVATAGCGPRETRVALGNRAQILHKGNGAEPQDLDPQIVTGVSEHHIIMALLEGLVTEDPVDLHPIPGVAERWDISPDGKVYTFHLRADAKWSNGDPVTANDFLESFKRMLMPSLATEYAYMHYVVKNAEAFNTGKLTDFEQVGYKVIDDRTLQITLENPTVYFLSLLNHDSWFPVHLPTIRKYGQPYERNNKWTRPGHYVGNGPFVLERWRVNDVIVVRKNPNYWDKDRVRLSKIYFYPIEAGDTEERAFRSGQLHATDTMISGKIPVYQKNHPELLVNDAYLGTYFYRFNVTKPPFTDKRVRQALTMAIDREAIVEKIARGGQLPAYNFTPPATAGYTARAKITPDLALAKKLLAEAGYPDGKNFPKTELLLNTAESHKAIAEAIQQMWKKNLGIEVELANQEWKVYIDSQRTLDYQVCRASWIADYVDPNSFLDMWLTGGGNNETGWSNKEYDQLIGDAGRETDAAKRLELFQKAEALLLDELPVLPIYFYTHVAARRPEVKGWYPTILDNQPTQRRR
ncbi:MAG: peptide ABC transporter substrate-binding protein [Verrucomicrobia bacterium]|nr:peptide ABC transporter substrate-binding protein [Verrucomicrobiota bacterium]